MIKDIIVNLSVTKNGSTVGNYAVSVAAALRAHLTGISFIYDPIVPDPEGIINQGQGNLTARAIQIRQGETINKGALLHLFQAVIANNRAGGWRKLKGSQ